MARRVIQPPEKGGLDKSGEHFGRYARAQLWICLQQPCDVSKIFLPFAAAPPQIQDRPDLPAQDIVDGGDAKVEA